MRYLPIVLLLSASCSNQTPAPVAAPALPAPAPAQVTATAPAPPAPAPVPTKKKEDKPTAEGVKFLRASLAELTAFKDEPSFAKYGFGRGGPHYQWLEKVEAERKAKRFSRREQTAVGDLLGLGMRYMSDRGKEGDYTRFARKEVEAVISLKIP